MNQRVNYKVKVEMGTETAEKAGFFGNAPDGVPYANVTLLRDGVIVLRHAAFGRPEQTPKAVAEEGLRVLADELRSGIFALDDAKRSLKDP